MGEPKDGLVPPQPVALIPPLLDELVLATGGLFSPSGWMLKAIELIPGAKDAIHQVEFKLVGDWDSVLLVADAIHKLGQFNADLAKAVSAASSACHTTWRGNAATITEAHFESLGAALNKHRTALDSAAQDVQTVAFGMQALAQTLEGLLTDLLDWVMVLAATAAACSAASATGWGALSWIAAGLEAYKAGGTVKEVLETLNRMDDAVNLFAGVVARYLGAFDAHVDFTFANLVDITPPK